MEEITLRKIFEKLKILIYTVLFQKHIIKIKCDGFILCIANCVYLEVHIEQPHIFSSVGITLGFPDGPATRTICAPEQRREINKQ